MQGTAERVNWTHKFQMEISNDARLLIIEASYYHF